MQEISNKINIINKSSKGSYGFLESSWDIYQNKPKLIKLNFGDKFDNKRITDTSVNKPKSNVDEKNLKVSTVVHEFAHLTTQEFYIKFGQKQATEFFEKLKEIQNNYKQSIRGNDIKAIESVYLGNYANTNLDEFLAEGFTEYKLKTNPSKYAMEIGKLFDKYFKK
jgi:uncharacterized protein YajQ (UPF0234 family)